MQAAASSDPPAHAYPTPQGVPAAPKLAAGHQDPTGAVQSVAFAAPPVQKKPAGQGAPSSALVPEGQYLPATVPPFAAFVIAKSSMLKLPEMGAPQSPSPKTTAVITWSAPLAQ